MGLFALGPAEVVMLSGVTCAGGTADMLKSNRRRCGIALMALAFAVAWVPTAQAQKINQIELTEQHVVNLLAAQSDFAPLAGKLAEASDEPDPKLLQELDDTAKKHGFSGFEQYSDVDNNIFFVLEGLDRETGVYVSEAERLKQESEIIAGEKGIPDDEKKEMLADIKEEMALAEPLKFPSNVDIVKKHIEELAKLVPEEAGPIDDADDGPDAAP
jgi:hypothetical protein